jgi:hypothetical protein
MKKQADQPTHSSESHGESVFTPGPPAMLREKQPNAVHARSHAAHLETGNDDPKTKPVVRPGLRPGARKQPNGGHGNRNRTTDM